MLRHAQRVLLDRLAAGGAHHHDRDLAAFALLERLERALEGGAVLGAERAGLVDDAGDGRDGDLAIRRKRNSQQKGKEQDRIIRHFFVPKSTLGGVAMAFSSSTVKFALVLLPKSIAVRLVGNERTVTLYCSTALM